MARSRVGYHLRSPLVVVSGVLLVVLLATAIVAPPLLAHRAGQIDVGALQSGASSHHPFGTDALGRDVFTRTLVATRLSLTLALITVALGVFVGAVVGAVPVVLGRRAGRLVVALLNLMIAFPGLLLALFLAMVFGVGARGAVLAMAAGFAPSFARLTHTTASGVANADYVSAARLLGVPRWRILFRHVLPNIAEPLVVNATSQVGSALLSISALSYLGFGVQPPSYDWGRMLADGLPAIYTNPAAALAPALATVIAGLTFVLAGEALTVILGSRHAHLEAPRAASRPTPPERTATDAGPGSATDARALVLDGLRVEVPGPGGPMAPVADVSLVLRPGEIVGMVGESGSGKSLTAMAIGCLTVHPSLATVAEHRIGGRDLTERRSRGLDRFLGTSLAMVFQDPMSSLNPTMRVGRQLSEVSEVHQGLSRKQAWRRAVDRLDAVRIPGPEGRAKQYPQEFSGGMRQRASIAMGLMGEPTLYIADEPTTALDVTVQAEVLDLLRSIARESQAAVLLISHDIAVVSEIASRVLVMYAGRVVEELPVTALAGASAHPYTRALVGSIPDMDTDRAEPLASIPGRPPHPSTETSGCSFAPRCAFADETCTTSRPELVGAEHGGRVACWHPLPPVTQRVPSTPTLEGAPDTEVARTGETSAWS
ncbi:MAG: dipeptide/oligopeptide/nickel ABC transporter permease/ATP-binding protein [Nocardioides sp.]